MPSKTTYLSRQILGDFCTQWPFILPCYRCCMQYKIHHYVMNRNTENTHYSSPIYIKCIKTGYRVMKTSTTLGLWKLLYNFTESGSRWQWGSQFPTKAEWFFFPIIVLHIFKILLICTHKLNYYYNMAVSSKYHCGTMRHLKRQVWSGSKKCSRLLSASGFFFECYVT